MNPFDNSATGFMELLSSQQNSPFIQPSTYETPSPSSVLGESEVPLFSTQGENPTASKRIPWTVTEDLILISAWLNTSKDVIVGNEQRGEAFWKRIATYFAASPNVSSLKKRESGQCKQRWSKINESTCKFAGSHQAATTQMASGMNEDDLIKLAHQIYENDYKKKFNMEHAWRALRHDQKWCALHPTKETEKNKRRKGESGNIHSSEASLDEGESQASEARPQGVKAAKSKGKRTATSSRTVEGGDQVLGRIQSLWDVRQKDFALKQQEHALNDKLTNKKLLECILAKSEPLSEIEEELKLKLIKEILL